MPAVEHDRMKTSVSKGLESRTY